jgi:Family of unknown function (DUF6056)
VRRGPAYVALSTALALPLAVYAMVGGYSRYTADDFCWAGILRTEGFFKAQVDWYTVYSPRYAFTFVVNVAELIGPWIVPFLPATAVVLWLAVLNWTFTQYGITRPRAFLLAEVAALATLQTAPDLPQSLYWQTGMLTYLLPLILATLLVGWIRRGVATWWGVAVSGLITFFAGGLSETYLIPQNVALTLALLASLALSRGRSSERWSTSGGSRNAHLAAAFAGGVLALVSIVIAPATAARVGGTPADLWLALSAAIATAAYQVLRLVRYFPFMILLCLAVPALAGAWPCRIERRWLVLTTAIVAITLPFCYFPSFYAQNGNPPARSLIVPGAILIGYLLLLGLAIPHRLVQRLPATRSAVALGALALVPIGVAVITWPDTGKAARYAALFDAEEQQIHASRNAGDSDITVPPLPANLGEDFVSSDRQNWFNVCVARYYGVRSIATPAS